MRHRRIWRPKLIPIFRSWHCFLRLGCPEKSNNWPPQTSEFQGAQTSCQCSTTPRKEGFSQRENISRESWFLSLITWGKCNISDVILLQIPAFDDETISFTWDCMTDIQMWNMTLILREKSLNISLLLDNLILVELFLFFSLHVLPQ